MKLRIKSLHDQNATEHVLPLETAEDFQRAVETFPQLQETLYRHQDIRDIANEMADYLSSGYTKAWISED